MSAVDAVPPRLRRPTDDAVVVFAVGDRRFAVPPGRVVEIGRITAFTPLPSTDSANLGVGLYRGRAVALVDVARRFGADGSDPAVPSSAPPWLCVFLTTDTGVEGLPVDAVLGFEPAAGVRAAGIPILEPAPQEAREWP